MPALLKDLKISEVSSVDRGAGEGVKIMLMKSDAEIDAYLKREFSDDERKELASSGKALPDGSFPIANKSDLENAIHAFGRAKDKAKTKAHIIARAKALGCSDLIPEGWDVGKSLGAHISAAGAALVKSAWSIFKDTAVVDKAAALTESLGQFEEHLQGAIPAELSKAVEAELALKSAKDCSMTEAEKKAAEEKAEAEKKKEEAEKAKEHEDNKKALAKALHELAVLKLSPVHQDYMDAHNWDEKDKQNFLEKSPEERDDHMKKNPIAKRLPDAVQKRLDEAEADRKILKALQEKDEIATFAKRATDIGLAATAGEILRKAYRGDADGIKKLEELIKGITAQVDTSKLFGEFGSSHGVDVTGKAWDRLQKLAGEYRDSQIKIGKKCSIDQAFVKVYTDPANKSLKEEHDRDEVNKRARVAP